MRATIAAGKGVDMEGADKTQRIIRQFLLGYLSEAEQQLAEERLTVDPDYLEVVLQVESELMEEYVAGQLSDDERRRFDTYILTNNHQVDELKLTTALGASSKVRAAANSPPSVKTTAINKHLPKSPQLWTFVLNHKLAVTAIALVVVGGFVALLVWRNQPSNSQFLTEELIRLNTQQNLSTEAINRGFIIGPLKEGLSREDQENKKFSIPETEKIIQLRLQIGAVPYQTFQAVLQTAEDNEILTLNDLRARTINGESVVLLYLPAEVLTPGDYQIRLSGLTQSQRLYLGRYTFRIIEK